MKANFLGLGIAAMTLVLVSCGDESEDSFTEFGEFGSVVSTEDDAVSEAAFEDIDNITEAGVAFANATGRVERDELMACAEITHDSENKTIVIDYGEGCTDLRGRFRSGMILISYTDHRYVPGAQRTVTFDNFVIDSVQVEGTRTITNISEDTLGAITFNVVLDGGQLTFPDGTFATREANFTRTWERGEEPLLDEGSREGSASGVDREGNNYSVVIVERIIFKRDCARMRYFIPVAGVKEVMKGDVLAIVDYGDGTCDNLYTVTVNGETTEYEFGKGRLR
ncbi:MAG: hypothetical protein AAGC88_11225 [Bacteroidota bacterium]